MDRQFGCRLSRRPIIVADGVNRFAHLVPIADQDEADYEVQRNLEAIVVASEATQQRRISATEQRTIEKSKAAVLMYLKAMEYVGQSVSRLDWVEQRTRWPQS